MGRFRPWFRLRRYALSQHGFAQEIDQQQRRFRSFTYADVVLAVQDDGRREHGLARHRRDAAPETKTRNSGVDGQLNCGTSHPTGYQEIYVFIQAYLESTCLLAQMGVK